MPLTRLDNLITSKTGKYIYVSPDDFNASDSLDNRGNTPLRPFVTIQRAFLEVARYSYVPGVDNDRFDQFTILLSPGTHYIDNRPGDLDTADIPVFNYDSTTDQWNDPSIFDLGNPNNVLYRFNGRDGGATIPRGTSLVGTDLRRTQIRALYVPDPADKDVPRTALFNVTGGCYFWQFTILDGNPETGPLNGKVYNQPGSTQTVTPVFSHHKMTNFVFADKQDLSLLYRKISKCFSKYQQAIDDVYTAELGVVRDTWVANSSYAQNDTVVFGGEAYKALVASTNKRPDLEESFWQRLSTISREFDYRIQENRIVGPLADTIQIDELVVTEPSSGLLDVTVRTKINHGLFPGQYVAVANTGLNVNLEGVFQVLSISATNPKEFVYRIVTTANAVGLVPGATIIPDSNATIQAEVDSVESASPYVFNVSIRSVWGICGIWADGRKATGFKSMVIAQYTGVSLQKDDRAFIRYDEFTNTWNQAPLTDAFATTPYHIKGDAYWKDDWRNFHVRASDDSFIQNVSIFAVGFADHFLLESGGDMSITNSNSNFGNTSMHSKGFKGFAFNQDKGGFITDIIPPQKLSDTATIVKTSYYPIDVQLSKPVSNTNKLYLTGDKANNYLSRPAASINGYRLGARTFISDDKCEKLYSTMTADQSAGETGPTTRSAVVYPQGFKRWAASLDTLSPANLGVGDVDRDGTANTAADRTFFNLRQDAANLIDANKTFIQAEAFGYILEKYPYLQNISYVNPNIDSSTGRYRDARNLILANRQEIIDYAYNQMTVAFPTFTPPSADKCKRDIGFVIDALAADLYDGGNVNMLEATKAYFNPDGTPLNNGLLGEEVQSIFAFNRARDWAKKAISNLLSNTSLLPVTSLTASGTTITVTTSSNHNLVAGDEISVGGATQSEYNIYKAKVLATGLTATQFRYTVTSAPSVSPATGSFYVSTVTIDSANSVGAAGRYKDASKLVTANRQEIIDRAFAEVSVQYNETAWGTDWVVPGDSTTAAYNRFRDAYRLIQKNKSEIVDRAAAQIAINYPDFYYPGDPQTTTTSRFKDSYRLIQQNRAEIITTAYNAIAVAYPSFVNPNPNKCQRDIGFFIDAVSLDIAQGGGNKYTRQFVLQYFNNGTPISNGLVGEEAQSNVAFNKARDEMKRAITNQLTVKDLTLTADPATGSNTSTSSCANVQSAIDTLTSVVTSVISAGNISSLPTETTGVIPDGEAKCKRDIGLFIDAVSLDIAQGGGNRYSRKFVQQYFTSVSTPLANGLVGEEAQSIVAFNAARDTMKKALTNQLYIKDLTLSAGKAIYGGSGSNITVDPSGNAAACADVQSAIDSLTTIITDRISAGNLTGLPAETTATLPAGETKCKRDLGYILDSVAQDLYWGGNEFVVGAIREYFGGTGTTSSGSLNGEIAQSVVAFNAARDQVKKAITNQLFAKNLNLSFGPATAGGTGGNITYNQSGNGAACVDVQATVDSLFGIISTTLNSGNISSLPPINNGTYDCANVRNTIDTLFSILTGAISAGNINNLPVSNPGPWSTVSESSKCRRDIGYIVEAITSDLRLGGNENTVNAAQAYYTGTSQFSVTGTLAANGIITGIADTSRLQVGLAVTKVSGSGSFGNNPTILSIDSANQITISITSGTNVAGSVSFIANNLDYIQNERVETLDAYDYVRNLAISSMRNHNTYMNATATGGSPIITVPSTNGLVIGMSVRSVNTIPTSTGSLNRNVTNYNDELEEIVNGRVVPKSSNYTDSIPSTAYIMKIGDGTNGLAVNQIQLGTKGSKFDTGIKVNAKSSLGTNTPVKLFFQLEIGSWSNSLKPAVDLNVIQDYNYTAANGECSTVVESINTYFTTFNTIINNGINAVTKVPGTVNTTSFAQRATLFTLVDLSNGALPTDPHHLETGTPVRLVPRARDGAQVDKRLIRLPKGFDTNTVYYVIAPGRKTDPYDYSDNTRFDGSAGSLQNLMLASSVENAAAGIFIYSPETQSIDENVIIDVYQYVLDVDYNLNQYVTRQTDGETFETDGPHVFDVPTTAYNANDNQKYQAVFVKPIGSNPLPSLSTGGTLSPNREYYVRYFKRSGSPNKYFKLFDTLAGAISGATPLSFVTYTSSFYTLSNKKRSPLRFDPSAATSKGGTWYIATDASKPNTILTRIRRDDFATKDKTPDTWFERVEDTRAKEDRVYRLRYVIPKYLKSVRDPLRGFVIKVRNDSTRRLPPQKIILKPTSTAANIAEFSILNTSAAIAGKSPNREYLGYTSAEHGPTFTSIFDPYNPNYNKRITTDSKVTFYVQSARKIPVNGTQYLELTVFNIGIEDQGFKNKLFTTVQIDPPQGGTGRFVSNTADLPASNTSNVITWNGASKGQARVHAYFNYEDKYYMILKDITVTSNLEYNPFETTTFTQGSVSAKLISAPNDGRSDINKNLYAIEGANVYTLTPGDTLTAENGSYTIASVEDVPDFEGTYYIFDINTIRRRIYGQQDGIYYLTCMRGDIRPFPTGSGVGENFRDFKFSQPVSKLYPEFYKNDPEWFKQIDATAIDPPATISAADNYIHGLVTVNDAKNSVTKEAVLDLVQDVGSGRYQFTGNYAIKAQDGGASAGSEARKISISGNSPYPTESKLYVELRRPSIARSGNHTFEYLGFGPGNYSTGFPARQEVVLSDIQDFYAQAKRENGGIVFYTGLNSNGDLYIGNRKINAITGEETFLESAQLVSSSDAGDTIGNFVTTFDGPVTFNDKVAFVAPNSSKWPITFQAPIDMDVPAKDPLTQELAPPSIKIKTNIFQGSVQDDLSLVLNSSTNRPTGDISISNNRIQVAVVDFNARGFQDYSIRTAVGQFTPDQSNRFGSTSINLGTLYPLQTGDILLKGEQVGLTGSVAWIYANDYQLVPASRKFTMTGYGIGINKVRLTWNTIPGTSNRYTNNDIGITSSNYQIRISGAYTSQNSSLTNKTLGAWSIDPTTFGTTNTYVDILLSTYVDTGTYDLTGESNLSISVSNTSWKEFGVIGSESIRTETGTIGDYKVGINTVGRAAHSAYATAFVSAETTPRANLDVVGNTFISGKKILNYLNESGTTKTETALDNALLVGGNSASPNNSATLRVATTNSGRVGINVDNASLDRTFVVGGDGRITGNFRFQSDIEVNGGDITTTLTTENFNILNQSTYVGSATQTNGTYTTTGLNLANYATSVNIATERTGIQFLNVANSSTNLNLRIGNNVSTGAATTTNISKINIGGAYGNNESNSYVSLDSKSTSIAGDMIVGYRKGLSDTVTISSTAGTVNFFNTITSTMNFGGGVSTLRIGGQGGQTNIRNALSVSSSLTVNSNITLNGGLLSLDFQASRGALGSTASIHTGSVGAPASNTIDIVSIVSTNPANINAIDTAATATWGQSGQTAYQTSINTGSLVEPIVLPALTGEDYYLPLQYAPTGNRAIAVNDYLLIDSTPGTNRWPEIVKVTELSQINSSGPYWIKVQRLPIGSFLPKPSAGHLDGTTIYKVIIQFDATWLTNTTTNSSTAFSIAEIGGSINQGDYIIVDRNDAGTSGEAVKITSTSQTSTKSLVINNGASTPLTVFSVDSTNGNTVIGNSSINNSGNLTVYGNLTLSGGCGNGSTTTNRKLTFNNGTYDTVTIDTCTGDAVFGSQYATVFAIGAFYGSTAAAHTTTTPVYVYTRDPFARNAGGPNTTLSNAITAAYNPNASKRQDNTDVYFDIPVNSIAGFNTGDLVLIYEGTGKAEIIRITAAPYTTSQGKYLPTIYNSNYPASTYPNGGRAQETTTSSAFSPGAVVVKINKDTRTTTLSEAIPATGRTAVESPNTNPNKIRLKLNNGDLIAHKLDNEQLIRIDNEFFWPDSKSGANDPVYGVRTPKSYRDPANGLQGDGNIRESLYFGGGNLTMNGDVNINSGVLRMYGTDSKSLVFLVSNDDGHPGDGSIIDEVTGRTGMYLKGDANIYGGLRVWNNNCQEYGACTEEINFRVYSSTGAVEAGQSLYVKGVVSPAGSNSTKVLHIDNLGAAGTASTGPKDFIIYQDGSIDAFGIKQYFNTNGGRRWTYVATNPTGLGQTITNPLQANNNYLVNVAAGGNTILYLPANAATGDMIRFIEVSGNLTYNTSLIIRALKINNTATAIQGDTSGSRAGVGASQLTTAWDSGELIVQTRNASFGLVFVGSSDAPGDPNATEIPSNLRGWWLVEM